MVNREHQRQESQFQESPLHQLEFLEEFDDEVPLKILNRKRRVVSDEDTDLMFTEPMSRSQVSLRGTQAAQS